MLYMRWAALPSDPSAAGPPQWTSSYSANTSYLRTALAVAPDAADDGEPDDGPELGYEQGRLVVKEPAKPDEVWLDAEKADRAAKKPAPRSQRGARLITRAPPRHVANMGDRRGASALTGPCGKTARMPKPPTDDAIEEARKKLTHALLPSCTWLDYIASALRSDDKLGHPAQLKALRKAVMDKEAKLTMTYVDYSHFLHKATGKRVTKPPSTAGRVKSEWRSAATLAVTKHHSVGELAVGAVMSVRNQHHDQLGGLTDAAARAVLQQDLPPPKSPRKHFSRR